MKFFSILILLLGIQFTSVFAPGVRASEIPDIKILWWNIGGGNFKDKSPDQYPYDHSKVDSGILALIQKQNPDVFIFAEYYEGFLNSETVGQLSRQYPYKFYLGYNDALTEIGVVAYSKHPFTTAYTKQAPSEFDDSKTHVNYPRRFQMLRFNAKFVGGQCNFNVFPIHLLMPWEYMNPVIAAEQILWGEDNSLTQQLHLFEKFVAQQNKGLGIIVGDFNLPSKFFGLVPRAFSKLSKKYNLIPSTGMKYSFDSPNENGLFSKFKKVKLDHAFVIPEQMGPVGATSFQSEILDQLGSDHRPMQVVLRNCQNQN